MVRTVKFFSFALFNRMAKAMVDETTKFIRIDLNQFKLHLYLKSEVELTLHFDSPSRRFYLSVIGLVVHEMKKLARITSIPLQKHLDVLVLLNKTVGMAAGSSKREHLLPRIYRKWKDVLPDLENAPLFKVVGRKKRYDDLMEKVYGFSEAEKDSWANLFEYQGSNENVRLRFSIDRLNASLDEVIIIYGNSPGLANENAWESFVSDLQEKLVEKSILEGTNGEFRGSELPILQREVLISAIYSRWKWLVLCALIGLVVAFAAVKAWENNIFSLQVKIGPVEKAPIPLPDKPSIAVLPFVNMSGDPEQKYFVDGITNDIITDLSKFKGLFVIASNSSFAYREKQVKAQEVSQDLGVRYILEGSVQRAGDRMRINAQLIDATTGKHLWAERYDRDAQSLFEIQDEIIETIVATLAFKVDAVERKRIMAKGTENLEAYDYWLRGRDAWFGWTKEANAKARMFYEKAMELDPRWARPYGHMAWVHVNDWRWGWSDDPKKSMELALEMAQKCNELDPDDYKTHWTLGFVYLHRREFDRAIAEYERAHELNSNDADFLVEMAEALIYMGQAEDAIAQIIKAMRLNPHYPEWHLWDLGWAYYEAGRYEESLAALKKINSPPNGVHRTLAAVYVRLGRIDDARAEIAEFSKKEPDYTLKTARAFPYSDITRRDKYLNDLRTAGLPE